MRKLIPLSQSSVASGCCHSGLWFTVVAIFHVPMWARDRWKINSRNGNNEQIMNSTKIILSGQNLEGVRMISNGSLLCMISEVNRCLDVTMVPSPFWIYFMKWIVQAKKKLKFIIIGDPFVHFNKSLSDQHNKTSWNCKIIVVIILVTKDLENFPKIMVKSELNVRLKTDWLDHRLTLRSESILGNWKPFKNDATCFLFNLKSSFRSQDI